MKELLEELDGSHRKPNRHRGGNRQKSRQNMHDTFRIDQNANITTGHQKDEENSTATQTEFTTEEQNQISAMVEKLAFLQRKFDKVTQLAESQVETLRELETDQLAKVQAENAALKSVYFEAEKKYKKLRELYEKENAEVATSETQTVEEVVSVEQHLALDELLQDQTTKVQNLSLEMEQMWDVIYDGKYDSSEE